MSDVREAREVRYGATPGAWGYVLAVAISLLVLALEFGVLGAVQQDSPSEVTGVIVLVLVFGAIPAVVIGGPGAGLVHLLTRRATSQGWAVGAAALLGLVVGLVVYQGDEVVPGLLLGVATGVGRLAVVPLAGRPRH